MLCKTYNETSCFYGYIVSFMNIFSLVESNGQVAHLLGHTEFFRPKNSSLNEIELQGKRLCLEALENLVHRGQGVGTSNQFCPLGMSQ